MNNKYHYSGLNDAQVSENRIRYGANVLTPPAETSMWQKIKECMHFWLLKIDLAILILSAIITLFLPLCGIYQHEGLGLAVVLATVLFVLTYLVAYLGGKWDADERKFRIDSLFAILLFALLLSAAISFYQGVYGPSAGNLTPFFEPIGIAAAVLLATAVAHFLEKQNEKTFKSLNEVNEDTLVKVFRNDTVCQVMRKDIVVDDIFLLEAGEEVPADAEILECMNLTINESSLTGEPSCFKTVRTEEFDKNATYPSNQIMKGCTVLEGDCIARVFAVGDNTASGKVFEAAQVKNGEATPLSRKLDQLAHLITTTSYVLGGIIILGRISHYIILHFTTDCTNVENLMFFIKYVLDSVMIAVTLIVVAVPEGLPMAVTLSLAFSMKRLMKQNTLPRTMHACETMGAVSVICSDKTGTLTQNQMKVVNTTFSDCTTPFHQHILYESIALNTTANLDMSDASKIKAIGNPTEGALLLWLHHQGVNYLDIRQGSSVIDRLQFSTERKYMASLVKSTTAGSCVVFVKGAPDILMGMCNLTDEERRHLESNLSLYQSHANRTLALAYKVFDNIDLNTADSGVFVNGRLNVDNLTMLGIIGIEDPVRTDVPAAIEECLSAGIQVKIVTGDAPGTAKEIGRQLGLFNGEDSEEGILVGPELTAMTDEELCQRLAKVKIISRARPNDKERVVRLLKSQGHIVAVTGDGTNDAPALNAANVGLSMGDGTAVAKEASDMTIIDNSFSTIANAVMWGRSLYKNIKRFILFQMTVNVAACLIVLAGAFIGTESPLTVTQMLWVNLIMDTFAALALASLPPTKRVMTEKPRSVNEPILNGMYSFIIGVGGLFTSFLLAVCLFFQHVEITYDGTMFDTLRQQIVWLPATDLSDYELGLFFTIFVMFQFWNLFNAKAFMTTDSAFKRLSWSETKLFLLIAIIILGGQIAMTEIPGFQEMFNVASGGIHPLDWAIVIVISSFVLWIGEIYRFFLNNKRAKLSSIS